MTNNQKNDALDRLARQWLKSASALNQEKQDIDSHLKRLDSGILALKRLVLMRQAAQLIRQAFNHPTMQEVDCAIITIEKNRRSAPVVHVQTQPIEQCEDCFIANGTLAYAGFLEPHSRARLELRVDRQILESSGGDDDRLIQAIAPHAWQETLGHLHGQVNEAGRQIPKRLTSRLRG